jgi:hypothetical protein
MGSHVERAPGPAGQHDGHDRHGGENDEHVSQSVEPLLQRRLLFLRPDRSGRSGEEMRW